MYAMDKKHEMNNVVVMAWELFSKDALREIDASKENMVEMVSDSSLLYLFEKPKFRNFVPY
jgi:hypothetical protein